MSSSGADLDLDATPAAVLVGRARRRPILRWAIVSSSLVVLVPFLYLLGDRIGTDPTLVDSPLLGKPAPAFDLARIDAPGRVRTTDLTGRIVVVNFWASWCVPCRAETPALEAFYQRYRADGVELVGIMYDDRRGDALAFRRELGGTWPIVDDPGGRAALDFGVRGVPETFVIDGRGTIMAKLIGAVGPGALESIVEQVRTGGAPVTARNDQYRTSRD